MPQNTLESPRVLPFCELPLGCPACLRHCNGADNRFHFAVFSDFASPDVSRTCLNLVASDRSRGAGLDRGSECRGKAHTSLCGVDQHELSKNEWPTGRRRFKTGVAEEPE